MKQAGDLSSPSIVRIIVPILDDWECALILGLDRSIGHYRRYSRTSLARLIPSCCELIALKSLDSVGLLASFANVVLLKQSAPSESQIRIWDKCIVPFSRLIDPLLRFKVGKSIVAIWQRTRQ